MKIHANLLGLMVMAIEFSSILYSNRKYFYNGFQHRNRKKKKTKRRNTIR